MATEPKDMPLRLRRRATSRDEDGNATGSALELDSDSWPPRHEFGLDWLMKAVSAGEAKVTDKTIELTLANAHAVYRVVPSVLIDGEERTSAHAMWGELVKGEVNNG